MAKSKKYTADDLFDSSQFKQIVSDFDLVIGRIEKFKNEIVEAGNALNISLTARVAELSKINFRNVKDLEKYTQLAEKQNKELNDKVKLEQQQIKLEQQQIKLEKDKIALQEKQAAQQKRIAKDKDAAAKATEKEIQNQKKLESAYSQLQTKLTALNKRISDLNVRRALGQKLTETEIQELKTLSAEQKKYDTILKQVDADLGKHQRNVGNYTESVKDAIDSSGLFGSKLSQVTNSLRIINSSIQGVSGKLSGLKKAFAASGIGALILALGAFKEITDNQGEAADAIEGLTNQVKGFFSAILQGNFNIAETNKKIQENTAFVQQNRIAIRALNLELTQLNNLYAEQANDANDSTLSIKDRQKAQEDAFKTQQKIVDNEKEQARLRKQEIQNQIDLQEMSGKINNALKDQMNEALIAEEEANAKGLKLQNDREQFTRQKNDNLLELENEYLRNKKATGIQENELLQQEIENTENSISKKIFYNDKLRKSEAELTKQIFANIEARTGKENLQDLLKIKNTKDLTNAVNDLNLDDKQREILINAIKRANEANNQIEQNSLKIKKETADMNERILKTDYETLKIQEERVIKANEFETSNSQGKFRKLIKLENEHNKLIVDLRNSQVEEDTRIAKSTIKNADELQAELIKISQQYYSDSEQQEREHQANLKEIRTNQIKQVASDLGKLLDETAQAEQKKFDEINSKQQKQIDQNENQLEEQRARAEQGLSNELAFRQEQADKLALQQKREQERQEKMQEVLAYLKLFTGYAEQDPKTALPNTLRDMALMNAAKLLFANEGEEFVSADGKTKNAAKMFARGKDVVPAMLAEGERVVTKDMNAKYNEALHAIHTDTFDEKYLPNYAMRVNTNSFSENAYNSALLNGLIKENKETNQRLQSLEKSILGKTEYHYELSNLGEVIETQVSKGLAKKVTYKKPRL